MAQVKTKEFNANAFDAQLAELDTVSAKIRFLDSEGWTRSQIANKLGKRYQHVRNVLITPLKSQQEG
jgi:hypothetical protein